MRKNRGASSAVRPLYGTCDELGCAKNVASNIP